MQKEQTTTLFKKMIPVFIIVGVIVGGYFFFSGGQADTPSIILPQDQKSEAQSTANIGTEITHMVTVLKALDKSVKESATIFSLPSFGSLENFSTEVIPETDRRENPFLPTPWKISNAKIANPGPGGVAVGGGDIQVISPPSPLETTLTTSRSQAGQGI